jgi:hypothetical protein
MLELETASAARVGLLPNPLLFCLLLLFNRASAAVKLLQLLLAARSSPPTSPSTGGLVPANTLKSDMPAPSADDRFAAADAKREPVVRSMGPLPVLLSADTSCWEPVEREWLVAGFSSENVGLWPPIYRQNNRRSPDTVLR